VSKNVSKQRKTEPASHEPSTRENLRRATGAKKQSVQLMLLDQAVEATYLPAHYTEQRRESESAASIQTVAAIQPRDEIEGMLAVQMVSTHNAAMECLRRAMIPDQTLDGRDLNLRHATKLQSIFTKQLDALNKHRGKGQQKVTVEHVHVEAGGQAVVGNVETGKSRK